MTPADRTNRVADRAHVEIPISFRAGDDVYFATVEDISSTGARIERAQRTPEVGSRISIHAFLEERESSLWITADVVRVTGTDGFAVSFAGMDESTAALLRRLEEFRGVETAPTPHRLHVGFQAETQKGDAQIVGVTLDGLFLSCDAPPDRGEAVRLTVTAADGSMLELDGVSCFRRGLSTGRPGFSMRLDTTTDEYLEFYSRFLRD